MNTFNFLSTIAIITTLSSSIFCSEAEFTESFCQDIAQIKIIAERINNRMKKNDKHIPAIETNVLLSSKDKGISQSLNKPIFTETQMLALKLQKNSHDIEKIKQKTSDEEFQNELHKISLLDKKLRSSQPSQAKLTLQITEVDPKLLSSSKIQNFSHHECELISDKHDKTEENQKENEEFGLFQRSQEIEITSRLHTRNEKSTQSQIGVLKNNYSNFLKELSSIEATAIYYDNIHKKDKKLTNAFNFFPDYRIIKEGNSYFIESISTFKFNEKYIDIEKSPHQMIVQNSKCIYKENGSDIKVEAIINGKAKITPQTVDSVLSEQSFLTLNTYLKSAGLMVNKDYIRSSLAGFTRLESSTVFNRYKMIESNKK